MAERIRIGIVYPQLLGTYGDRGNAEVLAWRLRRRGHDTVVVEVPAPEAIPADLDAYVLGGGEDLNQAVAVRLLLLEQGKGLRAALADDVPTLAVCGSLQLLGDVYLDRAGNQVPGMHVLDLETTASGPRCVGEVVAEMPDGTLLSGFENHGGRTGWAPARGRWRRSCTATATTARTAPRGSAAATSSPPTCTAPCSPATPPWRTPWSPPSCGGAATPVRCPRSSRTPAPCCTRPAWTRSASAPLRPVPRGGVGALASGSSRRRRRSPGRWGCRW
jgi:hypothetical protein